MNLVGRGLFILSLPLLMVYFRLGHPRSYVLLASRGEFLLLNPWYGSGQWHLPGGGCKKSESPAQAATRELCEETGITMAPNNLKLIAQGKWQNYRLGFTYYIFVAYLDNKPQLKLRRPEVAAAQWYKLNDLPPQNMATEIRAAAQAVNLV